MAKEPNKPDGSDLKHDNKKPYSRRRGLLARALRKKLERAKMKRKTREEIHAE